MPPALSFTNISHAFGPTPILDHIEFDIHDGEFTALLGPSGCGKSTILQIAAGLLRPTAGQIRQHGASITTVNQSIGFVPQQALLLPWKTLRDNVALPLLLRGLPDPECVARADAAIAAVDLQGFEHHFPYQLSGGMQKRGAIARTLVYRPDIILMDEPFGALDAQTRMLLQNDLQTLVMQARASVLLVTHDVAEAVLLADRVIVLSRRPARILASVAIDLPRPRNVFEPHATPGFPAAYEAVWQYIRPEMTR